MEKWSDAWRNEVKHMRGRSVLRRSAGPGISFQLYADIHIF